MTMALIETITEITERPNPPRRHRTYPRVVTRHRAHSHRIKRPTDRGQRHYTPPKIHISKVPCLT